MTGQVAPVAGEFRVATRRSRLLGPTLLRVAFAISSFRIVSFRYNIQCRATEYIARRSLNSIDFWRVFG